MEELELYTWQTLYREENGTEMWRTDPNHFTMFQECYDFGVDILSSVTSTNEKGHRIVVVSFTRSNMERLATSPFFYLLKDSQNAS